MTPELLFTDNVDRRTMDDTIEKKEELDPTVGQVVSDEEKRKEDEKKNAARYLKTTEEKKKQAREAWEKENARIKQMTGREIPDEYRKKQEALIDQGIEPRHLTVRGGSDAHAFEDFNDEIYKGTGLEQIAKEIKEVGLNEGMTEEKKKEFHNRIDALTGLGQVTEDENQRIKSDINEAVLKSQGAENSYLMQEAAGGNGQASGSER